MLPIPAEELARLEEAMSEADQLARDGQVLEGYELLDLMLSWAESPALDPVTWLAAPPDLWSEELSDRYRAALVAYCGSHHVVFPLPDPAPLTLQERIAAALAKSRRLRAASARLLLRCHALR
jgi:hypothetical protein